MGRRLYVGNLPYTAGEAELQELFSKAGTVESVRVMRDAATGRARGFAFVDSLKIREIPLIRACVWNAALVDYALLVASPACFARVKSRSSLRPDSLSRQRDC